MDVEGFKRWLRGRDFSEATITRTITYARYIERLGLDLDGINSPEDVLDFFSVLRERGVTRKTLNNHVKVINRYLRFRGVDFKIPYYREFRSENIVILSDDEVRRLLSVRWARPDVDLRNRSMLHLLFATGVRISELIALNWQDLFFDRNTELWTLKVRHGKWEKSREVPVPPRVVKLLYEYKRLWLRTDPNAMFTTTQGRMTNSYARRIMEVAGKKAGVKFHAHLARHWRAIKWLEAGVDIESIRRMLGHSSLKVTQIYLRAREKKKVFEEVTKDTFFGSWKSDKSLPVMDLYDEEKEVIEVWPEKDLLVQIHPTLTQEWRPGRDW